MKVTIIGGGIIGLCTAYYLQQKGAEVSIVDKNDFAGGTSHGNAGMIVPSHFIPLAAPGVIAQGIRWMFSSTSPFYIKPRFDLDLFAWLWRFYRSSNQAHVQRSMPVLRDFNLWSKSLYNEMAQSGLPFSYEEKGLLALYKTEERAKEEIETAHLAHTLGLEAEVLDARQVSALETGVQTNVYGGIFFPGDAHLYPNQLLKCLMDYLTQHGTTFLPNTNIEQIEISNGRIQGIRSQGGAVTEADVFVIAAGAWTPHLLRKLGKRLLLQDGKGYSVTLFSPPRRPTIPTILTEARVAITPMGADLRIGGTLEISNMSPAINKDRLRGILDAMPNYYPGFEVPMPSLNTVWHGFRPCPPDGLPYIGTLRPFHNLYLATGHAMMGLSLGPATGKAVSELIMGGKSSFDLKLFDPERFG